MIEVKYVEQNQVVTLDQTQCELQSGATWGLVRTTLREWDSNPNDPPKEYEHRKEGATTKHIVFFWPYIANKLCSLL